jgi:hypothetical protein
LDPSRVDPLLQFILVVAGQQDEPRDRHLGPIHFLKYAYLADLAHARAEGVTFTGAEWQFYDFGPWSPAVLDRVEPALQAIGAERKTMRGKVHGDFVRYTLHDERLLDRFDSRLPGSVVSAVRSAIREFGSDTPALLRHVYLTAPMLRASPGEVLDLQEPSRSEKALSRGIVAPEAPPETEQPDPAVAARQRRKIARQIHEELERRAKGVRPSAPAPADPAPHYDDEFFAGVAWLDSLDGEPLPAGRGELAFSPDIWKSRGRAELGEDESS